MIIPVDATNHCRLFTLTTDSFLPQNRTTTVYGSCDIAMTSWVLNQMNITPAEGAAWAATIKSFQPAGGDGFFSSQPWEPHLATDRVLTTVHAVAALFGVFGVQPRFPYVELPARSPFAWQLFAITAQCCCGCLSNINCHVVSAGRRLGFGIKLATNRSAWLPWITDWRSGNPGDPDPTAIGSPAQWDHKVPALACHQPSKVHQ